MEQEKQESILTCVRIKPVNEDHSQQVVQSTGTNQVQIMKTGENFNFQHVFDQNTKNAQIFEKVGTDIVETALQGINGNYKSLKNILQIYYQFNQPLNNMYIFGFQLDLI
ncbi:P-loop containing nucleoside triphosphate hydrolase [Pseudocohnilembus persalinus]|uniref:p-loop containing nucleoside triphosphate hydrolase n=1 Tax=Pseudocohnilembus persalinus TaxID=266149 RepID=A0A0V0QCG7_PSEPJ|nr:P-loop containing nucleoside triphosphate hydrolase [Pseudocohnilembus persalinus]|eukprot:KRW99923.1 P-loop containing nucleoside triphosphate hydrolase [Pseudocohnilembus persalinus]